MSVDRLDLSDLREVLNLPLNEKRKLYRNQNFVEASSIPTWKELSIMNDPRKVDKRYSVDEELNEKVSIFRGDITALEIDAIVNTSNPNLTGSADTKTVDGSIHTAAGPELRAECLTLGGCEKGHAKITCGHRLPARYVIHTVGPVGQKSDILQNCYKNCFRLMKENGLRTIAFPCISTGKLGYPSENAAHIALRITREFLERENNAHEVDRIIFCLFLTSDFEIYERLMQSYFPFE